MRNLKTVYQFELTNLLKKKAFIVTTTIICALIIIVTTLPTILKMMKPEETVDEGTIIEERTFGLFVEADAMDLPLLEQKLPGIELISYESEETLKEAVLDETVDTGYILKSEREYTTVVNNVAMNTGGDYMMESALRLYGEDKALLEGGHDVESIRSIMGSIIITQDTMVLGKDVKNNYWVVYALIMLTFMMIMFYGNNVATYVAREKSDRTMEILVTSSDSNSLIIGKVLASGTAGIAQALAMGVTLFVGYKLNSANYGDEILNFLNLHVDPKLLVVYFIFAFTGYFLFLFVYAGIGALMSKVEDVPSATTLVTMFVMAAYFIAMFSLGLSKESIVLKIASYFPFTSFMVMFVRYAITSVSMFSVVLSYAILLLTAIFIALASIKIYRFGTLNYGNKGSILKLIKTAMRNDNGR